MPTPPPKSNSVRVEAESALDAAIERVFNRRARKAKPTRRIAPAPKSAPDASALHAAADALLDLAPGADMFAVYEQAGRIAAAAKAAERKTSKKARPVDAEADAFIAALEASAK